MGLSFPVFSGAVMRMWLKELRERWKAALAQRGPCPHCGSVRVWHNGLFLRQASLRHGDKTEYVTDIPVRRLRCGACGKRWSASPEGVVSRGHYQPCVVAAAVAATVLAAQASERQVAQAHECHRQSLWRWVQRVAGLAEPAVLARQVSLESQSPQLPTPPTPVRPRRSARR